MSPPSVIAQTQHCSNERNTGKGVSTKKNVKFLQPTPWCISIATGRAASTLKVSNRKKPLRLLAHPGTSGYSVGDGDQRQTRVAASNASRVPPTSAPLTEMCMSLNVPNQARQGMILWGLVATVHAFCANRGRILPPMLLLPPLLALLLLLIKKSPRQVKNDARRPHSCMLHTRH